MLAQLKHSLQLLHLEIYWMTCLDSQHNSNLLLRTQTYSQASSTVSWEVLEEIKQLQLFHKLNIRVLQDLIQVYSVKHGWEWQLQDLSTNSLWYAHNLSLELWVVTWQIFTAKNLDHKLEFKRLKLSTMKSLQLVNQSITTNKLLLFIVVLLHNLLISLWEVLM